MTSDSSETINAAASAAIGHVRRLLGPTDPRSPDELEADLGDEFAFHLHMLEREEREAGLEPEAARAAARHRFGDPEIVRAACRRIAHEERIMLQRMNALLAVLLLFAVIGLGIQGFVAHRANVRTLEAVDALRVALQSDREAAKRTSPPAAEPTKTADAANAPPGAAGAAGGGNAPAAPNSESSSARRGSRSVVTINGAVRRAGPLATSASGLNTLDTILQMSMGLALPEPYRNVPDMIATATIRRPRGDGTDEVLTARWPAAGPVPEEPKIAAFDTIDIGIEMPTAPPPLSKDDILAMDGNSLTAVINVLDTVLNNESISAEIHDRLSGERERVANRMRVLGCAPKALAWAKAKVDASSAGSGDASATDRKSPPEFDRTRYAWVDGDIRSGPRPVQAPGQPLENTLAACGGIPGPSSYVNGAVVNVKVLRPRGDGTDETLTESWPYGTGANPRLRLVVADRATVRVLYPSPLPPLDDQVVLTMASSMLRETYGILAKALAAATVDGPTLERYRRELETIRLRLAAMGEVPPATSPSPGDATGAASPASSTSAAPAAVPSPASGPPADSQRPTERRADALARVVVVLGDIKQPGPYELPTGGALTTSDLLKAASGVADSPQDGTPNDEKGRPTFEAVVLRRGNPSFRVRVLPSGATQTLQQIPSNSQPVLTAGSVVFVRTLTKEEASAPTPADAPDALDRYLAALTSESVATLRPAELAAVRTGIDLAMTRTTDEKATTRLRELGAMIDAKFAEAK
ncbi:MAG: permease prefix domain 1-containing protein [Phycisphaerales bacterium]